MKRGDVRRYAFAQPDQRRPVLVLTRDAAISAVNSVTVAPITATIRSIPTEVVLTEADGLPATFAANFDNLQTAPKGGIGAPIAHLPAAKLKAAAAAIGFALGLVDV